MSKRLIVIGGGEHSRVVIEAARSSNWEVAGLVDPESCSETCERLGVVRLGTDDEGLRLARSEPETYFVLGLASVGVSPRRREVVERYAAVGRWAAIVHARAWVSPTAHVDSGAVVLAGALVNSGASVGRHCVVNTGAIIEHDVKLHEYAQIAPGTVIGGGSVVEAASYVGLGSRVRDHIRIGRGSTVGMGAAVVEDVPEGTVVIGVPAKPLAR